MTESMIGATSERLAAYDLFSGEQIDRVARVAGIQSSMSYGEFMDYTGVPEPEIISTDGGKTWVEVVDIRPPGDYDETRVRVTHLGMGNGLGKNQLYQIATVFAADPTVRTVAFGNLSGVRRQDQLTLSGRDMATVFGGNLRPLIDRQMRYLAQGEVSNGKLTQADQEGFSAGSLLAMTAAEYAGLYDLAVKQVVAIESADVKNRGSLKPLVMLGLGIDFCKTAAPCADYIIASKIEAFTAINKGPRFGLAKYGLGVLRASNLVLASSLAGAYLPERAARALDAQSGARLDAIWGTESELAYDGLMLAVMSELQSIYGNRATGTRVVGGKHNMVNDIHLQAALLLNARSH